MSSPYRTFEHYQSGAMDAKEFLSLCAKCARHREAFQTWPEFRHGVLARFREEFVAEDILEPILETLMSEERVQVAVADMMASESDRTPSQALDWLVQLCQLLTRPSNGTGRNVQCAAKKLSEDQEVRQRQTKLSLIQDEVHGKIHALDRQVRESFNLQRELRTQAQRLSDELAQQKEIELKHIDTLKAEEVEIDLEERRLLDQLKELDRRRASVAEARNDRKRSITAIEKSFRELAFFYDAKLLRESELQRLAATSKTQAVLVQSHCNSVEDALERMSRVQIQSGLQSQSDVLDTVSQSLLADDLREYRDGRETISTCVADDLSANAPLVDVDVETSRITVVEDAQTLADSDSEVTQAEARLNSATGGSPREAARSNDPPVPREVRHSMMCATPLL